MSITNRPKEYKHHNQIKAYCRQFFQDILNRSGGGDWRHYDLSISKYEAVFTIKKEKENE